jgi:glycosyltransferase involved in cell wall biosynthesis
MALSATETFFIAMSSPQPQLSVIMPAYNCAAYIEAALASIFTQGIEDIEGVVVDDGSTDGTADIAAAFDPRVRVFRNAHGGPAATRNLAVSNARADWLAFLDADDIWLPGKLTAQLQYLAAHPDARIVYGSFKVWQADADGNFPTATSLVVSNREGTAPELSGWIYPELLLDSHIHIITALIHRSVFDQVNGFDGSFGKGSDYDFWIRASRHFPAYLLNRDLALYRIHAGGITQRVTDICAGYELLNRAIEQFGCTGPDGRQGDEARIYQRLAEICFNHAYMHFWHGSASVAARFFHRAVELGRGNVKTRLYAIAASLKALLTNRR